MRIAVLIKNTTFHSYYGGFETQNKSLCEGLAELGHNITVYSPQKELDYEFKTNNKVNYKFIPCTFRKFNFLYKYSNDSWLKKSYSVIKKDHSEKPFDLIISQSSGGFGLILNKKDLGIKIISISHGTKLGETKSRVNSLASIKAFIRLVIDIPHILYALYYSQKKFILESDHIIAVSSAVKSALIEETGVDASKITVIHNGIDENLFKNFKDVKAYANANTNNISSEPNKRVSLLYVGRILRSKGLFLLFDALKDLDQDVYKLRVIGDGEDLNELKRYSLELDINDNVEFLGKKNYGDVIRYMNDSDIFVMPTIRVEGFPMVLVEAMFSGMFIITTDIGGNSDAIQHQKTGVLLPPNDVLSLKESLSLYIQNTEKRKVLSQNARIYANKNFSRKSMIEKYEKVINEVKR